MGRTKKYEIKNECKEIDNRWENAIMERKNRKRKLLKLEGRIKKEKKTGKNISVNDME